MEKDFGWDCEAEILELHQHGPGNSLAGRVLELAEAGDAIARDLLRDAANADDPRAQRRARAALNILQSEGAIPGGKTAAAKCVGCLGRTTACAGVCDADCQWTEEQTKRKISEALANFRQWVADHQI